jgi:hypothetical protein
LLEGKIELVPVVLEIVFDMDFEGVSPIGFDGGTGEAVVKDVHFFKDSIWPSSDIVDCKPILLSENND